MAYNRFGIRFYRCVAKLAAISQTFSFVVQSKRNKKLEHMSRGKSNITQPHMFRIEKRHIIGIMGTGHIERPLPMVTQQTISSAIKCAVASKKAKLPWTVAIEIAFSTSLLSWLWTHHLLSTIRVCELFFELNHFGPLDWRFDKEKGEDGNHTECSFCEKMAVDQLNSECDIPFRERTNFWTGRLIRPSLK